MNKKIVTIFFIVLLISRIDANELTPDKGDREGEPGLNELALLASIGLLSAGMEFGKAYIGPFRPNITDPGMFDSWARDLLVWPAENRASAAGNSDIFLGILASQIVLAPLATPADFWQGVMLFSESFIFTAFFTELVKIFVGRQRPYAYFGGGSDSPGDNYSFFSGHTSLAFAMATTGSLYLSERFENLKPLIYGVSFLLAALTGYMRIAADVHYLTDVAAGAVFGVSMGYFIFKVRKSWIDFYPTKSGVVVLKTVYF